MNKTKNKASQKRKAFINEPGVSRELKKENDDMSFKTMLKIWRFTPINDGSPYFIGMPGAYFKKTMEIKGSKLHPSTRTAISREIGF